MKRIKNSDIDYRLNPKLINLKNFSMKFYTVNSQLYFFTKNQDDVVEVERDATIYDEDVIESGGTKVTEYYLKLDWSELVFIGEGVLSWKCINNTEDSGFVDLWYNRNVERSTEYYIDSDIHVEPAEEKSVLKKLGELEINLGLESVERTEADNAINERIDNLESATTEALDNEIARAIGAETALDNILESEIERAITRDEELTDLLNNLRQDLTDESEIRSSADTSIWTAINGEVVRSVSAETALDNKIDNYILSNNAALQAEITRASSAETKIATDLATYIASNDLALSNEVSRATEKENVISGRLESYISTNNAALANENERATNKENAISGVVGSYITSNNAALQAEVTRASSAETKIATDLANYISSNDHALSDEVSRATNKENALSGAIATKQDALVSGTNIKTINNISILGSGNIDIQGSGSGVTPSEVQTMIDESISGKTDESAFTTHTADTTIHVTTAQTAAWDAKSDFSGSYTDLTDKPTIPTSASQLTNDSGYITANDITGKADTSIVTAHTADTTIHVTSSDKSNWNAKSDFSGSYNDLTDKPTIPTSASQLTNDSGYITSGDAQSQIDSSISGKQDTLVSGTNIKTINSQSILGSGDITISGGKALSGGTNINIVTGETTDTIKCTLNIGNGTGDYSIRTGYATFANKRCSVAEGEQTISSGLCSHAEGGYTQAGGNYSHAEGYQTKAMNIYEHASGQYNVSSSASTSFGNSGNTLFSVGNGTSNSSRHNAFEIRQNGDIYLSSGGTDIKLQDHLGGGGGVDTGTVQTMIDNSISEKADNSAVTAVQDSLSGYVYTADNGKQDIFGSKTFVGAKRISFTQAGSNDKLGFTLYDVRDGQGNAKEFAAFELNPTGITENSVTHPLLTLNQYRKNSNNGGRDVQTYIGYRQYDQPNSAAYHLLAPLPENAKTPFSLTTTFQNYYFPLGFKNGSTMIKADNTGVVDLSNQFSGKQDALTAGSGITITNNVISAKIWSGTQTQYDNLQNKDNDTIYLVY